MLLSASVERFGVSRMRDFLYAIPCFEWSGVSTDGGLVVLKSGSPNLRMYPWPLKLAREMRVEGDGAGMYTSCQVARW